MANPPDDSVNHPDGDMLDSKDHEWIRRTRTDAIIAHPSLVGQREYILVELRKRLGAAYVFWGTGISNLDTHEPAFGEFFDDADDASDFFDSTTNAAGQSTKYARYARITHEMNTNQYGSRFLKDLLVDSGNRHITVERAYLLKTLSFRRKLEFLLIAGLLVKRYLAGLDDFLFSLSLIDADRASGIGLHKAPGAPVFGVWERQFVEAFGIHNRDLLFRQSTQFRGLHLTKLTARHRIVLPFWLSHRFTEPLINNLLGIRDSRGRRREICKRLNIADNRIALMQHFMIGEGEWDGKNTRTSEAMNRLMDAKYNWQEPAETDDATRLLTVAKAYLTTNQVEKAKEALDALLKNYPNHAAAKEAQKLLDSLG